MGEAVAEHVQTGFHLFPGKILQHAFHHDDVHLRPRQLLCPGALQGIPRHHGASVPVGEHLSPHLDLVRQVHIKPLQGAIVHLGKLIVKSASQVDADGVRVLPEQILQSVPEENRTRHHALVGQKRVKLAHIHAERINNLLRFHVYNARPFPGSLTGPDRQRNQCGFLYIAKLQCHTVPPVFCCCRRISAYSPGEYISLGNALAHGHSPLSSHSA